MMWIPIPIFVPHHKKVEDTNGNTNKYPLSNDDIKKIHSLSKKYTLVDGDFHIKTEFDFMRLYFRIHLNDKKNGLYINSKISYNQVEHETVSNIERIIYESKKQLIIKKLDIGA